MLSGGLSSDDSPSSSISIASLSFFLRLREPPVDRRLPPAGGLYKEKEFVASGKSFSIMSVNGCMLIFTHVYFYLPTKLKVI